MEVGDAEDRLVAETSAVMRFGSEISIKFGIEVKFREAGVLTCLSLSRWILSVEIYRSRNK